MSIIIGLLITVMILLLIVIIEYFPVLQYVYTEKNLKTYFSNGRSINNILMTIDNKTTPELLAPPVERQYIAELDEMFDCFKKQHTSWLLDEKLIGIHYHEYSCEIHNAFSRKLKNLA
jgi:hypothetical protein